MAIPVSTVTVKRLKDGREHEIVASGGAIGEDSVHTNPDYGYEIINGGDETIGFGTQVYIAGEFIGQVGSNDTGTFHFEHGDGSIYQLEVTGHRTSFIDDGKTPYGS